MVAQQWTSIEPERHEVRLVVCDMDGTLLDADHAIPEDFWPLLDRLGERGIAFAPASGRQHATLARMFARSTAIRGFVCENGAITVVDGEVIDATPLDRTIVDAVVEVVRAIRGRDIGVVLCGVRSAWVERDDEFFTSTVGIYNAELAVVDDLHVVEDDILKISVVDFEAITDRDRAAIVAVAAPNPVVASEPEWVHITSPRAHKGQGVAALQRVLGVEAEHTMAFGDYHNDLQMLAQAGLSVAMGNAHPDLHRVARWVGPDNTDQGVLQVLRRVLGD